jgi:four helix bundle protein
VGGARFALCVGMPRDHTKLTVFQLADALAIDIYQATLNFPVSERWGIQSQLRRAAVSTACNIVEGSARSTTRDYVRFLNVACASASEARYLISLAQRLELLPENNANLMSRSDRLVRSLKNLVTSLVEASGEVSG